MKTAAVIPCRYQSSRFEGKPLALIGDKPMMWHVYQQASKANSIDEIHIATDDERIATVCRELGLNFLMTSSSHLTGTDRVAECARMLDAEIIVNIQGDEPFILPESIDAVTFALSKSEIPNLAATNGYSLIEDPEDVPDPCVVKVLFSSMQLALAYSRLPIPLAFRQTHPHYRQLGLYAFRREALEFFSKCPQGPIEAAESVEMYRFVEHDKPVLMVEVTESGIAVDTPSDLHEARLYHQFITNTKA
jgi:3-deoxy-manno-octulosonate cytidylyltransferase (CMP-KDO synthetase)